MALFNSWYCTWGLRQSPVRGCLCWWSNGTHELGGAKQDWAGLTFTVPDTGSTPSEYSAEDLNEAIRAVQRQRRDWRATLWTKYKAAQKEHIEGRKTKNYNAVQRQQLERRKLRRCKPVKAQVVAHSKENPGWYQMLQWIQAWGVREVFGSKWGGPW